MMESKLRLSTGQCAKMLQMQECPQSNGYRQLSRAGMERSSEDNSVWPQINMDCRSQDAAPASEACGVCIPFVHLLSDPSIKVSVKAS